MKKYRLKLYKKQAVLTRGPFGHGYYSIIYAISAPTCGLVKIGRTKDIERRFDAIQSGSPVPISLLGYVWLPTEAENHLHEFLSVHRSHGEWFRDEPEVRAVIDLIVAKKVMRLVELTEFRWNIPDWVQYIARARRDTTSCYEE